MVILIALFGPAYLLYALLDARSDGLEQLTLVQVCEGCWPTYAQAMIQKVGHVEELAGRGDPVEVRRGPEARNHRCHLKPLA